jgi:lipopolysaccharide transport system permease protein
MADLTEIQSTLSDVETVYEPSRGWISLKLSEVWTYRELLYFLAWRDIKIRYKQAVLGVAWAILQPLFTIVIFTVIFGNLAGLQSDGFPYAVFSFAALLPWNLFATALSRAGISLVNNANLLTKVYFPRLVIPLSAVLSGLVDFGVAFLVLLGMMAYYHIQLTWAILTLPLFILLAMLTALAVGLWFSSLNVLYRDVQFMLPFVVQAWMFASPVIYSVKMIPAGIWQLVYGLNPMTGVIQGFRWALLGTPPPTGQIVVSVVIVIILLVSGFYYFKRMEKTFADVV